MNNIFKKNSRFDVLIEDQPKSLDKKNTKDTKEGRFNPFKKSENSFRTLTEEEKNKIAAQKEEERKIQIEYEEREKERKKMEALNLNCFPELLTNKTANANTILKEPTILDYSKKVKNAAPVKIKEVVQNKIHDNSYEIERQLYESEMKNARNVFKALTDLHEKRTKEYIDDYGYDNWEQMFRFPNYDYNYFDRLDEEYEEYLESLENETDDDESEEDYDNY